MPYGEKLKLIKTERHLTNLQISTMCDVPLATVTRIFDEKNPGGNFETYVAIARGLGISLDELIGLKQPNEQPIASPIIETLSSYSELLKEKDERIKELTEDKKSIRKEKYKLIGITFALGCVVTAIALLFIVDILNGHMGHIRY